MSFLNFKEKKRSRTELAHRLLDETSPFAVRESFNLLRTNLMYTVAENEVCPIYAITSVTEASGKSTVITNLALSFTQVGKRILLVDGDMRCPVLHKFFDLDEKRSGLSELISGIDKDVVLKDVLPGLDLITSGRIPPNPSELLTSPRLKKLLAQWQQEYDVIFIDFPPIGVVTDALAVCQEISGYLFDVRSGRNSAKEINDAIEAMEQIGAKIVGVVLNDYNLKGSGSHYKSGHYGKYGKYSKYSKYSKYNLSQYERSSLSYSADLKDKKETKETEEEK